MDVDRTQVYFQAMEVLRAQEHLFDITINNWSDMKQSDRKSIYKKLHRVAYPDTHSKEVTPAELAKILGAGTIKAKG